MLFRAIVLLFVDARAPIAKQCLCIVLYASQQDAARNRPIAAAGTLQINITATAKIKNAISNVEFKNSEDSVSIYV